MKWCHCYSYSSYATLTAYRSCSCKNCRQTLCCFSSEFFLMRPDYLRCPTPPIAVMNHLTTMIHSRGSRHINTVQDDVTDRFPLIHTTRNVSSTTRTAQELFQKMAMLLLTQTFPLTLKVSRLPQKTVTKQKTPDTELQIERRQKNESRETQSQSQVCPSQQLGIPKSRRVIRVHRRGIRLVSAGWELSLQSPTRSRLRQVSPSCHGIRCGARVWQVRSRRIQDQRKCIVLKRASREKGQSSCVCHCLQLFLLALCIRSSALRTLPLV